MEVLFATHLWPYLAVAPFEISITVMGIILHCLFHTLDFFRFPEIDLQGKRSNIFNGFLKRLSSLLCC